MRLIHTNTNTAFDLQPDTEVSLELTNPFFEQSVSITLPFTLPDTPLNRRLLNNAQRLDAAKKASLHSTEYTYHNNYKTAVRLYNGSFVQAGTLLLLSYSPEEGFEVSVILGESSIWSRLRDVSLRNVFTGVSVSEWDDTPGSTARWITEIQNFITGHSDTIAGRDELVAFPVYSEKGYINCIIPVRENNTYYHRLLFASQSPNGGRLYKVDNETLEKPTGMGISVFLKLEYVIRYIFEQYLGIAEFTEEWPERDLSSTGRVFPSIVVINNTIDTIITGTVFYDTLVPDIPVLDFLQSLFAMFGIGFIQESENKVRMCFLGQVLKTEAMDISSLFNHIQTISYEDGKRVVVEFNHIRLDGDADITNYAEMQSLYSNLTKDEYGRFFATIKGVTELVCYDQFDLLNYPGRITQDIQEAGEPETVSNSLSDTRLISNELIEVPQLSDMLVHDTMPSEGYGYYKTWLPLLPGLNNRVCSIQKIQTKDGETIVTDLSQNTDCPLLLCYLNTMSGIGGRFIVYDSDQDGYTGEDIPEVTLRLGTPYWTTTPLDLTARGICSRMHQEYNRVLKQGAHHLTVVLNLTLQQLHQFDFAQPLSWHGRRFLPLTLQVSLTDAPLQQVAVEMMAI